MKLGVVGSRLKSWKNPSGAKEFVFKKLDEIHAKTPITKVVSGGEVTGADRFGKEWALSRLGQSGYQEFKPDLKLAKNYGYDEFNRFSQSSRRAYGIAAYTRNKTIVDNSDKVIAFWDGKSRGTAHSIGYSIEKRIPGQIITQPGASSSLVRASLEKIKKGEW